MRAEWIQRRGSLCDRAICFGGGFFLVHAPQSMTRALALLCGGVGTLPVFAAYELAQRPHVTPEHVAMVIELTKLAGVLWGGGVIALLVRTKPTPSGGGQP